ncbi:hypothetical protein MOX02_36460 [Methylobacterium oxalidis]|uniref:DUF6894 domain-containing protein n=1 Tax=Methylobacterium oxalidis TaxID=944322 RepID=A0A512J6K4_9HYPH|nr:hypothetical protein MOX02_36460 [Methylobacterium oxalidis]GLS65412.1 hypothetical protein GCM10007888_37940 [Methylobacterium oxalidis]
MRVALLSSGGVGSTVARYYIDVDGLGRHSLDCGEQELPSLRAVRKEAIGVLLEVSRDALGDCDQGELTASVRDGSGRLVFRARLSLMTEWPD